MLWPDRHREGSSAVGLFTDCQPQPSSFYIVSSIYLFTDTFLGFAGWISVGMKNKEGNIIDGEVPH